MLVRLLIAESRTPAHAQYDADEVKKGMQAMKATVVNRLNNNPGQFGATGATTFADIIAAPGQFHGFTKSGGNITISTDVQSRITEVMRKANTGSPGKYAEFVKNAIAVANGAVSDPFKDLTVVGPTAVKAGAFGWRKAGSAGPGGSFVQIPTTSGGVIAGNQFYTVKK